MRTHLNMFIYSCYLTVHYIYSIVVILLIYIQSIVYSIDVILLYSTVVIPSRRTFGPTAHGTDTAVKCKQKQCKV